MRYVVEKYNHYAYYFVIKDLDTSKYYGQHDDVVQLFLTEESANDFIRTLNIQEYSQEFIKHVFDK